VELKNMLKNLKIMALESEMAGLDISIEKASENDQPRHNSRLDELQKQLEVEKQERQILQEELVRSNELVQMQEQTINEKEQELQQTNELINQTVDELVKEAIALKTVESAGKYWLGLVRDKKKDENAALKIQSLRRGQLARRREKDDAEIVELRAKFIELSELLDKEKSTREALQKQMANLQAPVAKFQALSCTAPSVASSVLTSPSYTPSPMTPLTPRIINPIASARSNDCRASLSQSTLSAWARSPQPAKIGPPRRNACSAKAPILVEPIRLQAIESLTAR
jgi:hypothetical protein